MKLFNRFPAQKSFEVLSDILEFASSQLAITDTEIVGRYINRRETIAEHQERIREYLGLRRFLRRFGKEIIPDLEGFLYEEACRLEHTGTLVARAEHFLREKKVLQPPASIL